MGGNIEQTEEKGGRVRGVVVVVGALLGPSKGPPGQSEVSGGEKVREVNPEGVGGRDCGVLV